MASYFSIGCRFHLNLIKVRCLKSFFLNSTVCEHDESIFVSWFYSSVPVKYFQKFHDTVDKTGTSNEILNEIDLWIWQTILRCHKIFALNRYKYSESLVVKNLRQAYTSRISGYSSQDVGCLHSSPSHLGYLRSEYLTANLLPHPSK